MKSLKISFVLLAVAIWFACNNADTTKPAPTEHADHAGHDEQHAHSGEHIYACPMHPEVTGKPGDSCPKCGMDLVHNDNAGVDIPVSMQLRTAPQALEAGKAATLFLTPQRTDQPGAAVPLDVEHEKKIHLIIVSDDLSYFEHIHPQYDASGAYQIRVLPGNQAYTKGPGENETYFANGGKYWVYADYKPSGGNHKLDKFPVEVAGKTVPAQTYTAEKMTGKAGPFTLALVSQGATIAAGQLVHLTGQLTRNGAAVDANSLETYLGAKAHVVIINTATKDYLHVHPAVKNGALDLHTTFDQPGIYRAWIQVKNDGKVHTADFVIQVGAGTKTPAPG